MRESFSSSVLGNQEELEVNLIIATWNRSKISTLIMKYTIIFGFFGIFVAVSAISSGNFQAQRIQYPQGWLSAARNCLADIPSETYESFVSYNKTAATRAAKCSALCYYMETGEFTDGKFDEIEIENFLRKYVGPHQALEKLVEVYKAAAAAGNAEVGDSADKAYAYHAVLGLPESIKVLRVIFRPVWGPSS